MHKQESILENAMHKILWDSEIQTDHLIPIRRPGLVLINKQTKNKQKRTFCLEDFAVQADHSVKIKESEKINKYLGLANELKKMWNMWVIVMPIVVGALGTVPKVLKRGLEQLKIRGRIKTIQTTDLHC